MKKSKNTAEAAVQHFHQQLEQGDFQGIYAGAGSEFKKASTEQQATEYFSAVHRKLGVLQSTNEVNWNVNSFNGVTRVVLTYETKFAQGQAQETFTFRGDGDQAVLVGYTINSPTLITK